MAYTTEAVVRTATGFSNDTNITDATIELYIADADSVINAKLADRYALPLAISGTPGTPDTVEMLSRTISKAFLYADEYGEESQDSDKGWKGIMDWAMSILDDIQKGKMKLYNDSGVEYDRSSLSQPVFKPTDLSSEASAADSDEPKLTMNEDY